MRQHAGRLRKAQSLTPEVKGELAARQGAVRLQAATRGFLARRQARAALVLPLSVAAAQQQLQGGVSVDQLACHEALVVADPAPARLRSRLRTALPQLPVHTPHGVSMNWFGLNVIIPTASAMASMQVVPCAAMLVERDLQARVFSLGTRRGGCCVQEYASARGRAAQKRRE